MPPPADLAEYKQVYEELPAEMWGEVVSELAHRRTQEKAASRRMTTGQWLGFVVALAFLGVAAWLINGGHDVAGTFLGTVDIVGLVAVFVIGQRNSDKPAKS
jgi:uncharacterized membrane protein